MMESELYMNWKNVLLVHIISITAGFTHLLRKAFVVVGEKKITLILSPNV